MKPSKTIEWLRELVQLPSVNPGGSNYFDPSIHCEKRVTDWLENWAKGRGIHYFRQPVAPDRDNLIMIVEGKETHQAPNCGRSIKILSMYRV